MKKLTFVGALAFAFALGSITTLLGYPRIAPTGSTAVSVISVSPEDLTRSAGPMPLQVVENYM
jgi:hypothetical protein